MEDKEDTVTHKKRAKIEALIADLQATKEGSRELSDRVLLTCGWEEGEFLKHGLMWRSPDGALVYGYLRPDPTRSVDDCKKWVEPDPADYALVVMATIKTDGRSHEWSVEYFVDKIEAFANTEALARCAAALKWRLEKEDT